MTMDSVFPNIVFGITECTDSNIFYNEIIERALENEYTRCVLQGGEDVIRR